MQSWWFVRGYQYQAPGRWGQKEWIGAGEQSIATDQVSSFVGWGYQPIYVWQYVGGAWVDRSSALGLPFLPEVALGYERALPPNETPPPPPEPKKDWAGVGRVLLAVGGVVVLVWGASRRAALEKRERERKRLGR